MEITGRPTVHPALFIGGKAAGYVTWIALLLAGTGVDSLHQKYGKGWDTIAYMCLIAGLVIVLISSYYLGRSIRIGLPDKQTKLKTAGIYRLSRNPMYLGVHLITFAAMFYTLKWWVILLGLFSFYTYHRIILGEEKFLEERFGDDYKQYKKAVRRYI